MAGLKINVAAVALLPPPLLLLPLTTMLPSMASAARRPLVLTSRANVAALGEVTVTLPSGVTVDPPPPSVGSSVLRLVPGGADGATSDPPPSPVVATDFSVLRLVPGGADSATSDPPPSSPVVDFSVLRLVPGGPNSATSDPPPPPSPAVATANHGGLLPAGKEEGGF